LVETELAPLTNSLEGGLRVLIVDDDPELRRAIREVFLMRGFAVNTAENGAAAIKLARREHYDVVVSDLRMPEMDGIEVTLELKRLRHPPRVVLITAYPEWNTYEEARKAGAERLIGKPVSLGRLVSVVEQLAANTGVVEMDYRD
jgi:CheY-like chemotaxis protein